MRNVLAWDANSRQRCFLASSAADRPPLFAYDCHMTTHYIREWRKHRGLTLQQLCDRLESKPGEPLISFSQLARIERGVQGYRQEQLEAIAQALDITTGQLLSHNPSMSGDVIDLTAMLDKADPDKRKTIIAMIKAALAS
jgi:transcriptional regulator with XRE-family HTH domain